MPPGHCRLSHLANLTVALRLAALPLLPLTSHPCAPWTGFGELHSPIPTAVPRKVEVAIHALVPIGHFITWFMCLDLSKVIGECMYRKESNLCHAERQQKKAHVSRTAFRHLLLKCKTESTQNIRNPSLLWPWYISHRLRPREMNFSR